MRDIAKRFGGVRALRGVHFELGHGEVHALVGENGAGKSTLINILSGVFSDYEGEIAIEGAEISFRSPADAKGAGVATIHQELDLVPEMTVAENLFLGRELRTRLGFADRRRMRVESGALLERAGISIDPSRKLRSLRVGEQQLVEIAKALALDARILVMDEPTSALAEAEVEQLFTVVRELRAQGVGVVYVSHRLDELPEVADRATVVRDGEVVGTVTVSDASQGDLIAMMVGQPLGDLFPKGEIELGEEVLRVDRLTVVPRRPKPGRAEPRDVSFGVRAGEIVGLAGLMGAGRTELLETLFGDASSGERSGSVMLGGEPLEPRSPRAAIDAGVGFVPEDRKALGLVLSQSVTSNVTIAALEQFARAGLMSSGRERSAVRRLIRELGIKTSTGAAAVRTLSGGNQQKVVFAKQLLVKPRLLLLDEPTRGVDVGAKAEIYRLLSRLAGEGMAIMLASSELPELLGVCDRILVLRGGAITTGLSAATATQEDILTAATATRKEAT